MPLLHPAAAGNLESEASGVRRLLHPAAVGVGPRIRSQWCEARTQGDSTLMQSWVRAAVLSSSRRPPLHVLHAAAVVQRSGGPVGHVLVLYALVQGSEELNAEDAAAVGVDALRTAGGADHLRMARAMEALALAPSSRRAKHLSKGRC